MTGAEAVGGTDGDYPVVLVVDDDEDLADTYAAWLQGRYEVRTAYGGEEALAAVDDDVDVVLLDRRMPRVTGDEVLTEIREQGHDCPVSMLTAVEPDTDIVDLPFDEYLTKPVTQAEVVDTVEELLLRESFDEETREYLALHSTEDVLAERDQSDVRTPEVLEELSEEVEAIGDQDLVREQVAELNALKRVNGLVREVNRTLVEANTREELEREVCQQLTERAPYQYALVGDYTAAYDTFSLRTGSDGDHESSTAVDAPGPVVDAVEEDRVIVDANLDADDELVSALPGGAVGERPDTRVVVPLTYRDTVYGAVVLYPERGHEVSERERAVLSELGNAVANAINGVESKRLLFADTVVELEILISDRRDVFVDLSAALDCRVTLEGFIPSSGDEVTCYFRVEGADSEDVLDYLATASAVTSYRGVDESQPLFEATIGDSTIVLTAASASADVTTFFVESGEGTIAVEIAPESEPRTVLEAIQQRFPDTEFVRKRSQQRSVRSTDSYRDALDDDLTERQRSVIEAAYEAGYFEWPRESDGEELAEAMGISSPTLHQHLRHGVRKLAEVYLEKDE